MKRSLNKGGDSVAKQRGRPVKAESERKEYRVEIRLNEKENELLNELSKAMNISRTDTIITALNYLKQCTKKD